MKTRLGILISGSGSNMLSIAKACQTENFPAKIALVISNNPAAKGLQYAQDQGLQTMVIDHQEFNSREKFERELDKNLTARKVDLVCLAGFMRILSPFLVSKWQGNMLNIHPSLLPQFTGLDTHRRVLAAKVKTHGCSVHFVTAGLDEGPVLGQSTVEVLASDDEKSLQKRVLKAEHLLYPEIIRQVCQEMQS